MHPASLTYLAGTIDMLCKDLLEAWSEPSTYTFSLDGSSLTMNENSGYGISGTFAKKINRIETRYVSATHRTF